MKSTDCQIAFSVSHFFRKRDRFYMPKFYNSFLRKLV